MSRAELCKVRTQLDALLARGWIQPSTSPYNHPILLVKKKDGSTRMCIDFCKLNANTKIDCYPIPRVDDLLDKLEGCHYFSKVDLAQSYHQMAIAPEDTHKAAFQSRWGLFEYKVMPFRLTNAPATF